MVPEPDTGKVKRSLRVVVAGGGTGGHLFPGIAVANAFMDTNEKNRVLFIGPGRPFEIEALALAGFPQKTLSVEGIKGRRIWDKGRAMAKIPLAISQAMTLLGREGADLVVSVGGYAAGPVGLAAWLKGIPLVVCEQNTLPGITHRMLFPFASRIFVSFEETQGNINPTRKQVSGNPVRADILAAAKTAPGKKNEFIILVLGGSQGAHKINLAVIDALSHLANQADLRFIHQTGETDHERVMDAYTRHGVNSEVRAFFHDMAAQYQKADLVVCRAGATTLAELAVLGKPAILIPYPFAADNHQEHNARLFVENGAARMILEKDLDGPALARKISTLLASPDQLATMGERSRTLGRPDAASFIVKSCYQLVDNLACT